MLSLINANSINIPLRNNSVHMVATSPPYWGLRDYGEDKQLGMEPLHDCLAWALGLTPCPTCYICQLRKFAREVWRVLRKDGVFFLNLGDSYGGSRKGFGGGSFDENKHYRKTKPLGKCVVNKSLALIPFRAALALQADGWIVRSDIIWSKTNPMPESVNDRPTKAHEYIFLLSKSPRYYWDKVAIAEPIKESSIKRINQATFDTQTGGEKDYRNGVNPNRSMRTVIENFAQNPHTRNVRSVWHMSTQPYSGAHFAVWPPALVERMIKAGSSEKGCCSACGAPWKRVTTKSEPGPLPSNPNPVNSYPAASETQGKGKTTLHMSRETKTKGWEPTCKCNAPVKPCIVLDPFSGSGTTGMVARQLGRSYVGLDLSLTYILDCAKDRLSLNELENWNQGKGIEDKANYSDLPLFILDKDKKE